MPEARLAMPFDPNSPRNSLPPLNDGYPDDWFVPPSAQDDSFPDDWVGPIYDTAPSASQPAPSAQPFGVRSGPNYPGNPLPRTNDGYSDDWFVPPSAQDDSFPHDWVGPGSDTASSAAPLAQLNAPSLPALSSFATPSKILNWQPGAASGGLVANMVANLTAPLSNPAPNTLFGSAGLAAANTDVPASYPPASQSFTYPGGNFFGADL
jgi:hypothetical protein